jgi:hypothetical protein
VSMLTTTLAIVLVIMVRMLGGSRAGDVSRPSFRVRGGGRRLLAVCVCV